MFLFSNDYKAQIRAEVKSVLGGDDPITMELLENEAQTFMMGYLGAKFDNSKVFISIKKWDATTAFLKDQQIYFTATAFSASIAYTTDQLVSYLGKIYQSIAGSAAGVLPTDATKWTFLALDFSLYYVAVDNVPAGTLPTVTASFTSGDRRHPVIVLKMIDIVLFNLHSNLSQRQIPELREKRHELALDWLIDIRDGKLNDPYLPVKVDADGEVTGTFMRNGSNTKNDWHY